MQESKSIKIRTDQEEQVTTVEEAKILEEGDRRIRPVEDLLAQRRQGLDEARKRLGIPDDW